MRRIVIGDDDTGQGRILADDDIAPLTLAMLPGAQVHRMWELDEPPQLPLTGLPPRTETTFFPGPGGLRFGYISIPGGLSYEPDPTLSETAMAGLVAEAETKVAGMMASFDPQRPGMHATDSMDMVVVLSGQGRMRIDDGTDVTLQPGDCVIQHGTPHGWFNDGTEPFVFCYTLCGVAPNTPVEP
ncbi:cupin domain-containing protein [Nocardia vermiculata]|uniref:Cupin domain-containing protein n=1 Tax=Nocardia vermiculata TaxID=257274 RepID=A0A846XSY7_9NOCA|nr:cupin domain-containing protein [Nocardia vermiculata]NKY48615.1 cupin domain-containing protein [Nocardia vermiculata]